MQWADDVMPVVKKEMSATQVYLPIVKKEMSTTQVCFACLTWLYGLFVGTLVSLTNAYADCGRPTLFSIERFRLVPVRSVTKWDMTKLNLKLNQMNCITMHKCTEMYSEREIQNFDELQPEPERSCWRRDEKVNADSEASTVCKHYVELFSVKVNLKVFCILCLYIFFMLCK